MKQKKKIKIQKKNKKNYIEKTNMSIGKTKEGKKDNVKKAAE